MREQTSRAGETTDGHALGWIDRLTGRGGGARAAMAPLYAAIVTRARQPHWYVEGAVPDTVDGRFDMVAAILALVLLRLETASEAAGPSARLTELFVADMDGQLREIGIGDIIVGKHIGRMMAMLGGRLGAYREGLADGGDLEAALVRNVWRGEAPAPAALAHVAGAMRALRRGLAETPVAGLLAGTLP